MPNIFAAGTDIAFYPDTTYEEDGTIDTGGYYGVDSDGVYNSISGSFSITNDECRSYVSAFTFTPGSALPADATVNTDEDTGEFSIVSATGMNLVNGDEVISGFFSLSPYAPSGTTCESLMTLNYSGVVGGSDVNFENIQSFGNFTVDRTPQEISYNETVIEKTYGDDNFINLLTETTLFGPITYYSNNEDIAMVNSTSGEVQIVGAGSTTITAVVGSWYNYGWTSATYTLNVAPKSISISDASVLDKTYDGTTDAEVGTVTLSESSLIQGVDYEATAVFDDANVGDDKTATVTVTLLGDAANNYTLASNTFGVDNLTIDPYAITSANIDLEYYMTRYSGTAKEPEVTVKIGTTTVDPNDYDVEYTDNVDPGMATVTVTAKNGTNITSSASQEFEIINKEVLDISGIATPQTIDYTGSPVVLEGTLTVGANTDGITADDINIVWYEADGITEIAQPTNAGNYVVKYFYDGVNYRGELLVSFEIQKAVSPEPEEMTGAGFTIDAGKRLADIEGTRTLGFSWDNEDTIVLAGRNGYGATYTYNNDTANYTTLTFEVVVYGESHEDEGGDTDTDTDTDDGIVDVPDTGRFTGKKSEISHGAAIDTIAAVALVVVAAVLLLGGKFAKSKIDFDKK